MAAAAWTDACVPLGRAFHSGAVDAKNARVVRAALLDADDRKTLAVRSAAWAILANRLTLGLGDGDPAAALLRVALGGGRRSVRAPP